MAIGAKITAKTAGMSEEMSKAMEGYPGIFHELAGEHAEVATLMEKVKDADDEERAGLFKKINQALISHARAEEECFYPELNQFSQIKDKVGHCLAEHERIEKLLGHLNTSDPGNQAWMESFEELKRVVELHVSREEKEVFPQALHLLGRDRAGELRKQYEEAEQRIKSRLQ